MKHLKTETVIHAKAKLALAACMLLAASVALAADNQDNTSRSSTTSSSTSSRFSTGAPDSQTGTSSSLSSSDQKFVREAAKGGMMEVHMGKLGVQKSQNEQVKQYAQRLIDDHTKANAELKQLAASKGITLPSERIAGASSSDNNADRSTVREHTGIGSDNEHAEHAGMMKLEGLSGTAFDREFVRMAVKDHEKDVKEFEKEAQKASDPDVKAFAQKTAPTLREHLQQAKSLESSVGAAGSSSGQSTGTSSSSTSTDTSSGIK